MEYREIVLQKQQESFYKLMEQFTKRLNVNPGRSKNSFLKYGSDNLVLQISEFHNDPEADFTFYNWFDKYKYVLRKDQADIPEEKRVTLHIC